MYWCGMTGNDSALSQLVLLGLREASLAVLEEMLRAVAHHCGGFGVTLWQLRKTDGSPPGKGDLDRIQQDPSLGQLYVLAHGFDDNSYRCAYHDLPLTMATGRAVLLGEYDVPDAERHPLVDHNSNFAKLAKPGSLCAVRVSFPDGSTGAVTLYRRQKGTIDLPSRKALRFLASHIPALYAGVRDRVAYRLVDRLSVALGDAESLPPPEPQRLNVASGEDPSLLRSTEYSTEDPGITPYV